MDTKCFCGSRFANVEVLHQHATSRGHRVRCECGKLFKTLEDLFKHQVEVHKGGKTWKLLPSLESGAADAPITTKDCNFCNKKFKSAKSLQDHKHAAHPACPVCKQSFVEPARLEIHKRGTGHCYCDDHDLIFATLALHRSHNASIQHVTGFECLDCDRTFRNQRGLSDHLKTDVHAAAELAALDWTNKAQSAAAAAAQAVAWEEANLECVECKQQFKTLTGFKQHKDSVKHNKLSELKCPLSDKCKKTFTSPSSLLHHLESGGCKSKMNRLKLNVMVHMHDTGRHITHAKNAASVLSSASAAGSLPSAADISSVMSSLSLSDRGGAVLTPSASDAGSVSTIRGGVVLTPSASEAGSISTIRELDDDDIQTIISASNGAPIATPSASTITQSRSSCVSSSSTGSIQTPASHSRASSLGGVPVPSLSVGHPVSEWSFVNGNYAPPVTSFDSSAASTVRYDEKKKVWPCNFKDCGRTFREQKDLMQHLNSPFHAIPLYHCPTGLEAFGHGKKVKDFKTLSGFAQHIEAGACAGGKDALKHIAGLFETEIAKATGKHVKLLKTGAVNT